LGEPLPYLRSTRSLTGANSLYNKEIDWLNYIKDTEQVDISICSRIELQSEKLDKKFIASLMQQVTISTIAHDKSMQWITEAKREHIRANVNINILTS
jgi:hypothetical protein